MRHPTLLLALAFLLALPAGARSSLYHNARFGFQVQVPAGFAATTPPANDDGRTFRDPSGPAELRAWGFNNVLDETVAAAQVRARAECGRPIAYQAKGKNWYVLSWTDGQQVVYEKVFLGPGSGAAFRLTYPMARKSAFDPIVAALEKSFRPGNLAEGH